MRVACTKDSIEYFENKSRLIVFLNIYIYIYIYIKDNESKQPN